MVKPGSHIVVIVVTIGNRKQVQANIERNLSKPLQLIFSLYAGTCLRSPTIKIYENQALTTKSLLCRQAFVAHC